MRDGTRIAVDLWMPRGFTGKLPAIIRQTRYFRGMKTRPGLHLLLGEARLDPINASIRRFMLERGYAWMDVDVRGSGASFGAWRSPWSPDEVTDSAEIV